MQSGVFFLIQRVILAFLGIFWYQFKTFICKKYSKSKQTKYSGFGKLGVRWAERDIVLKYLFSSLKLINVGLGVRKFPFSK